MADKKTETKKALIVKDFSDAGTEQNFTANSIVDIEVGAFGNYAAAGLVREPTADEKKAPAPAV